MNIPGTERAFVVIGENIHTTRVLLRKGKLVGDDPNGVESIRFRDGDNNRRFLHIPEDVKKTQDYEEGRVKHLKIAIQQAMQNSEDGLDYLKRQIQRQEDAGSNFLDLNVDEISLGKETGDTVSDGADRDGFTVLLDLTQPIEIRVLFAPITERLVVDHRLLEDRSVRFSNFDDHIDGLTVRDFAKPFREVMGC